MRRVHPIVAICIGLGPLLGQDGATGRDATIGIVRDGDGNGVATATVSLLGVPIVADPALGERDESQVVTDARGRFRVELLPGIPYSIWASAVGTDGGCRGSAILTGIVARQPIVLDVAEAPNSLLRRIELSGTAAWGADLTVDICSRGSANLRLPCPRQADGSFAVPAIPSDDLWFEVSTSGSVLAHDGPIDSSDRLGESMVVEIPAPRRQRFAVRDIATGAGVAGATIRQIRADSTWLVATTDADGCAEIDVGRDLRYVARGAPFAPAEMQAAKSAGGDAAWKPLREGFEADWLANVGEGAQLTGRVRISDLAVSGAQLVLFEGALHFTEKNSRSLNWSTRSLTLDEQGRFTAPGVLSEFPPDIVLLLGRDTLAHLPEAWRACWPIVLDPFAVPANHKGALEFEDLDLAALVPVRFELETADGAPALGATLAFFPGRSVFGRKGLPPLVVDRAGGVLVLLPPNTRFALIARVAGAMQMGVLSVGWGKGQDPQPVAIRMADSIRITGRATGPDRRPIAGARLWSRVGQRRDGRVLNRRMPRAEPMASERVSFENSLEDWPSDHITLDQIQSSVRTDVEGHFVFEVPDIPMPWTISGNGAQVTLPADEWPPKPVELGLRSK